MILRFSIFTLAIVIFYPSSAHAYVDPGLVSMVIQGIFATVAGFTALYVVGPWRWFVSLFRKSPPDVKTKSSGKSNQNNSGA